MAAAAVVAVALWAPGACGDSKSAAVLDDTTTVPSTSTTMTPPTALAEAGIGAVMVPPPEGATDPARVVGVRLGDHEGYDRVVFEIEGDLPGYEIEYLDGPAIHADSGEPVEVNGSDVLVVRLSPASSAGRVVGLGPSTGDGQRADGDLDPVIELVALGDTDTAASWGIVVDGRRPFQVSRLAGPTRLVVDITGV